MSSTTSLVDPDDYRKVKEFRYASAQERARGRMNEAQAQLDRMAYGISTRDDTIKKLKLKNKKLRKEKSMADEMSIQVYDPSEVRGMSNEAKEDHVGKLDEAIGFIKAATGKSDKEVDKIKMKDINKISKEASEQITIGKFRNWMRGGIKADPMILKLGSRVGKLFSKSNAEVVFGLLFVASIATLIIKLVANATAVK